jgi:hypothetical protein
VKLLVVSPDYASHVDPMLQIGVEWQRELGSCVVATGPSVRPSVERSGLGWTMLQLGRGSNAGVIRADEQPVGEDDHLRAFFAATRAGAVETLRYQALARRQDLLFEPERVLADLERIIDAIACSSITSPSGLDWRSTRSVSRLRRSCSATPRRVHRRANCTDFHRCGRTLFALRPDSCAS